MFMCFITASSAFNNVIMFAIIVNAITIALENQLLQDFEDFELDVLGATVTMPSFFWILDNMFLTIYFWEFVFKFYAEEFQYFLSVCFEEKRMLQRQISNLSKAFETLSHSQFSSYSSCLCLCLVVQYF